MNLQKIINEIDLLIKAEDSFMWTLPSTATICFTASYILWHFYTDVNTETLPILLYTILLFVVISVLGAIKCFFDPNSFSWLFDIGIALGGIGAMMSILMLVISIIAVCPWYVSVLLGLLFTIFKILNFRRKERIRKEGLYDSYSLKNKTKELETKNSVVNSKISKPPVFTLYFGIGFIFLSGFLLFYENFSGTDSNNQVTTNPQPSTPTITVSANKTWNNTGIQIKKGATVTIRADGQINVGSPGDAADKWVDPEGWGNIPQLYNPNGRLHQYRYAVNNSMGCLIGKIDNNQPFYIGKNLTFTADRTGFLYLGVNDVISDGDGKLLKEAELLKIYFSNNQGSFSASVEVK